MSMILPIVTFLPLLGALMCLLIPREEVGLQRGIGMGTALVTFLASLMMLGGGFDPTKMNYEVKWDWAPALGIHFHLGIDGISLWLVLLTTFLMPIVFLSTISAITDKVREFIICALVLRRACWALSWRLICSCFT
jgi:NADH-quinone oxidoreductase subunit M